MAKNRTNPEGSIVIGFIAEEARNYCSVFLAKAKEIGIPNSRHKGRLQGKGTVGRKLVKPPLDRYKKSHRFVLQNLSAVHPYIEKHLHELKIHNPRISSFALMQEHNHHVAEWFEGQVNLELSRDENVSVMAFMRSTTTCLYL